MTDPTPADYEAARILADEFSTELHEWIRAGGYRGKDGGEQAKAIESMKLQVFARAIAQARAEEREACAEVCEAIYCTDSPGPLFSGGVAQAAEWCAAAIRRRGDRP